MNNPKNQEESVACDYYHHKYELACFSELKIFLNVKVFVFFLRRDKENSTVNRDDLGDDGHVFNVVQLPLFEGA